MNLPAYPWPWLADGVGAAFVLRYPWIDAARRAATGADVVCVLIPEAAGPLDAWEGWLAGRIEEQGSGPRPRVVAGFREACDQLCDYFEVEERLDGDPPAGWSRRFLAECRRSAPHAEAVPLLVAGADDGSAEAFRDLVQAQRELGYAPARPVLLRRSAPPEWNGEVVRFGVPEWVGDLNRIVPDPSGNMEFWTELLLALTVAWEVGAVPGLADELWENLRLRRTLAMRQPGFDDWLGRELSDFARQNRPTLDHPLPPALAFGSLRVLECDEPWHRGAVSWDGGAFDVTPMTARVWAGELEGDGRDSLRRRRLTNLPLARWLSAWASSIEESMRIAALRVGSRKLRRFLESQPPRDDRHYYRSRLDQFGPEADGEIVGMVDFGDLASFLANHPPGPTLPNLRGLLESCRRARNRVVHERCASTWDFLAIAKMACWLQDHLY